MHRPFDKFAAYLSAVQDPEQDLRFVRRRYREAFGKDLCVLAEDFCGTFALCSAWVRKGRQNQAIGVDYAAAPLVYGMKHHHAKLTPDQRTRLRIARDDVRSPRLPKAEAIVALNFSYFIFKERKDLLAYFRNAWHRLSPQGLLVLDAFGGSDCQKAVTDVTRLPGGLTYYWEQQGFDHGTHGAKFQIHFKRRGERKREGVFDYDWRLWTLPELRDVLLDAGFSRVEIYWESDGPYRLREADEDETTWLAYLVAFRD